MSESIVTIVRKLLGWVFLALAIAAGLYFGIQSQRHECGMCGASTFAYYYVAGADGSPCEVCEHCYLICFE